MKKVITKQEYEALSIRIEELLKVVGNDTPITDKNYIELGMK